MARLGHALLQGTDAIIASVAARSMRRRTLKGEPLLDDEIEASFVRLGTHATAAVARWIAGESVDGAFAVGEDFSRAVAQMVASSDVPLAEAVRRCQYWRDACVEAIEGACGVNLASDDAAGGSPASDDAAGGSPASDDAAGGSPAGDDTPGAGSPSAEAASSALRSIHISADHALASMSQVFDRERWRIQQELTRRQEELAFLATHDGLTKLANRSLVVARLEQMLEGDRVAQQGVAVLFIDLDGFKEINDTLGHSAGDRLLAATAARLRAAVRETDTLGRLGGDEFVVLAASVPGRGTVQELADRLCEAFAEPFAMGLACGPLRISASIGVALAQPGCSAAELLHDADLAMYGAKSRGRSETPAGARALLPTPPAAATATPPAAATAKPPAAATATPPAAATAVSPRAVAPLAAAPATPPTAAVGPRGGP